MNNYTMSLKSKLLIAGFLMTFILSFSSSIQGQNKYKAEWPSVSNVTRPWTRWWWHGSAVNEKDLTANLEELKDAGFGGVEITSIYGTK